MWSKVPVRIAYVFNMHVPCCIDTPISQILTQRALRCDILASRRRLMPNRTESRNAWLPTPFLFILAYSLQGGVPRPRTSRSPTDTGRRSNTAALRYSRASEIMHSGVWNWMHRAQDPLCALPPYRPTALQSAAQCRFWRASPCWTLRLGGELMGCAPCATQELPGTRPRCHSQLPPAAAAAAAEPPVMLACLSCYGTILLK